MEKERGETRGRKKGACVFDVFERKMWGEGGKRRGRGRGRV